MSEILIIEDDMAIQNLLKVALKQEGYGIKGVATAPPGKGSIIPWQT